MSYFQKKGWYLHGGTEIFNRCDNNFELALTPILNNLYILQIYQTSSISTITQISAPATF